jgi:multidrug efflux pump
MLLSDISVKRPVFSAVISLLLISFGILSFMEIPLREYPDVSVPIVSISTNYPGASADVVETKITQIIEDRISGIEGIKTIQSTSQQGRSNITIEFNLNRDIDGAANDVRDRVSRLLNNIPDEADPPEVSKADTDSDTLMWLHLTDPNRTQMELTDYAKRYVVDQFSILPGVASVRFGGRQIAMRIWLNRNALAARGLTVQDVEDALRNENVEFPAGRVDSISREFAVRVIRNYKTANDFASLVLKRGDDGHLIRLGEVAKVEVAPADTRNEFRGNGQPMIGMGIIKQSKANEINVAREVHAEIAKLQRTLPEGMDLGINNDNTVFIQAAIDEVYKTLGVAVVLVIAVIYLFLGSARATIIPAVTVPVCLIASFIVLKALGFSVNLMTLLALVLAIGLVVDDAIVVLENIHRRIELGEPPLLAAYRGARQVGFAVVSTTLVLIAVFVPIMFLTGTTGRMFAELAAALGAAVAFSGFIALTLTPMMCSKILKHDTERRGLSYHVDRIFDKLSTAYRTTLAACLPHPVLIGGAVLCMAGVSVFVFSIIPREFTPAEDQGRMQIQFEASEGASYDYTRNKLHEIEAILLPYIKNGPVMSTTARIPGWGGGDAVNQGNVFVAMKPWGERKMTTAQFASIIRKKVSQIPGIKAFIQLPQGLRGSGGNPVQFVVGGNTYEQLAHWRDIILDKARQNPGLTGLNADYEETKPELVVDIDRNRAADLGVSISNIGRTLETMLNSRKVTTFTDRGEEYDVIVQGRDEDRQSPHDLDNIYVRSSTTGSLIPISNLVKFSDRATADTLHRFNRYRAITITANLAPGYKLGEALDYLENIVKSDPRMADARIDYKGDSRDYKDSTNSIYFFFGLALLVVFLVLSAQFESFIHPFVIMLTVPLAVTGALVGLYIFNNSLNIYSQIGIIMLIGIAAKNGILIVEFANQIRDEGRPIKDALLQAAGIRLRPILMTAIATMFGSLPLALASGAGAASRVSLGIVVFSGVGVATFLTLFVIPVFYNQLARFTTSPEAVAHELEVLQNQPAE